ncbi:MAG TPA: proton-conducting transporter membrane subunit [Methylomirabilota bacterium]|nr:proton-conducting transporter membrane subunit [Methylomirabilota bacterium]
MTDDDLLAALPALILGVGAVLLFVTPRWLRADERAWMLLGAIVAAGGATAAALAGGGADGFEGLLRRDGASGFIALLAGASAATTLVVESADALYDARHGARAAALVLAAACGATLAGAAGDLVIALAGITLVALFAMQARRALVVPLLFGAGIALVFADAGSTRVGALGVVSSPLGEAGIALVLSAVAAVAGLVPFHLLARELDVAVPPMVAGAVGLIGRVGAFALLLRAAGTITASGAAQPDWSASIAILAALTMTIGAIVALARSSVRGVLAFIGVSQAGTLAVALASGVIAGPAIAFGLVVLAATTLGAYAVVAQLGKDPRLSDLRGLARRRPVLASAFAAVVFGLAGLPPTAGFVAKVYLFEAAIGAQLAWLVIVGSFTAVVAVASAFRLVFACLGEAGDATRSIGVARAVAIAAAVLTLGIGVLPGPLLDAVQGVRF